jgi:cysteine synthase B
VNDENAFTTTRRLALEEGIFAGMSSGAAVCGALEIAKRMERGTIVVVLPDRGDRYLSTSLFTSVCAKCPP